MSLAEARPRRHLPSAPSPAVFDQMVDDAVAELHEMRKQYRWLYPSGYARDRKGGGEKVRRDISGAGSGLDDVFAGGKPDGKTTLDMVRHHLEEGADHLHKGLAHIKGVSSALGKAQDKVENATRPVLTVAADPLGPGSPRPPRLTLNPITGQWDNQDARLFPPMTPAEAKEQQQKREDRLARTAAERKQRQEELVATVVRAARLVIEKGEKNLAALGKAIVNLDKESATFVASPWGREESTG